MDSRSDKRSISLYMRSPVHGAQATVLKQQRKKYWQLDVFNVTAVEHRGW
jgi:hypothetical protein